MICEEELRPLFERSFIVRDGNAADEIGPAIPRTWCNLPEQIRRAPDWTAAAFVIAIIGDIELVTEECEAKRIAQTPGDEFRLAALRPDAEDRAAADGLPSDDW